MPSLIDPGLDRFGVVYTPHATTGAYTVVATTALPCRLALIGVTSQSADMGPQRVEIASGRRLLWGPDYAMPETAQVEIDGERWNIQAGTLAVVRGLGGEIVYRRAEVVRAI